MPPRGVVELHDLPDIHPSDVVPGNVLHGKICGSLRALFARQHDPQTLKLRFTMSTRMQLESQYSDAFTAYSIEFIFTAPRHTALDSSGEGDFAELNKEHYKRPMVIDLTGAVVRSAVSEGNKIRVVIEGEGERRVEVRGRLRTLFEQRKARASTPPVTTGWDFYADGPDDLLTLAASASAAPGPSRITERALSRNNSGNAAVSAAVSTSTRALRAISAIPQLTFLSSKLSGRPPPARVSRADVFGTEVENVGAISAAAAKSAIPGRQSLPSESSKSNNDSNGSINSYDIANITTEVVSSSAEGIEVFSPSLLTPVRQSPIGRSTPGSALVAASPSNDQQAQTPPRASRLDESAQTPPRDIQDTSPPSHGSGDDLMVKMAEVEAQIAQLAEMKEALQRQMAQRGESVIPETSRKRAASPDASSNKRIRRDNGNVVESAATTPLYIAPAPRSPSLLPAPTPAVEAPGLQTAGPGPSTLFRREADARARQRAQEQARQADQARQAEDRQAAAAAEQMLEPFRAGNHLYTPLNQLKGQRTMSFMGVVVDPGDIRGGSHDHYRSVVVTDPSLDLNGQAAEDTVVVLFRKSAAELGGIERGCPILFRGGKICRYKGKPKGQLFSNAFNEWALLRGDTVVRGPSAMNPENVVVSREEFDRLKALRAWWASLDRERPVPPLRIEGAPSVTKKERQLCEVHDGVFFDSTVQVLSVHPNDRGGNFPRLELYVTDGTVNSGYTRNFHNVEAGLPPSAIFCLSMWDPLPPWGIKKDNVLFFPNLRVKGRDGLELNWSDRVTKDMRDEGWQEKVARRLDAQDPKAIAIHERVKDLRASFLAGRYVPAENVPPPEPAPVPPPPLPVQTFSTEIFTTFNDSINHPVTPLAAALADPTVPNKYRIQARVTRIEPVPTKNGEMARLAVTLCTKCGYEFSTDHCRSCNDKTYAYAKMCWRIIVFLEIDAVAKRDALVEFNRARGGETPQILEFPNEVALLLSDEEAAACLPPLPEIHSGPNELRRSRVRARELEERAAQLLLGSRANGDRTRPTIDWGVMKYAVPYNLERRKKHAQTDYIVVWKAFGMTRKS